jgi:hypothetical protein
LIEKYGLELLRLFLSEFNEQGENFYRYISYCYNEEIEPPKDEFDTSPRYSLKFLNLMENGAANPMDIGFARQAITEYLKRNSHSSDVERFKDKHASLSKVSEQQEGLSYEDIPSNQLTPGTLYTKWEDIQSPSGMTRHTFETWALKAGVIKWHNEKGELEITLENILKVKSFRDKTKKGQNKKCGYKQ